MHTWPDKGGTQIRGIGRAQLSEVHGLNFYATLLEHTHSTWQQHANKTVFEFQFPVEMNVQL